MIGEDMEDIAGEASHAKRILAILEMHDLLNVDEEIDESEEDS
jgi:hypothetical protein